MGEEVIKWESNKGINLSPDGFRANPIGKGATKGRYWGRSSHGFGDHTFYELLRLICIDLL